MTTYYRGAFMRQGTLWTPGGQKFWIQWRNIRIDLDHEPKPQDFQELKRRANNWIGGGFAVPRPQ